MATFKTLYVARSVSAATFVASLTGGLWGDFVLLPESPNPTVLEGDSAVFTAENPLVLPGLDGNVTFTGTIKVINQANTLKLVLTGTGQDMPGRIQNRGNTSRSTPVGGILLGRADYDSTGVGSVVGSATGSWHAPPGQGLEGQKQFFVMARASTFRGNDAATFRLLPPEFQFSGHWLFISGG